MILTGSNTYSGPAASNGSTLLGSGDVNAALGSANCYSGGTTVTGGVLTLTNGVTSFTGNVDYYVGGASGGFTGVSAGRTPITPIPKGPVFYIITEGAGLGDSVRTVPCTGNETVMKAVSAVGGISQVSSTKIRIARPSSTGDKSTILTVDWEAISKRGINATNYTLMPGDRLVFGEDRLTTQSNLIGKKTAPIERIVGIVSLTASTLRGLQQTPGAGKLVTDLVRNGLITDDEHLKKFILDAIHDEENKKVGAKATKGTTPREGEAQANAVGGKATVEVKVEQGAGKTNTAGPNANDSQGHLYLGYRSDANEKAVAAPHELAMQPLPAYRIEPPDVIQVEMLKLVPLPPYRAETYDVLQIKADAPHEHPVDKNYMVEADGTVDLGPPYGTVKVAGMTIAEMRAALDKSLSKSLAKPAAYVQLVRVSGTQPVTGQYLVGPDGTINLRKYGLVSVSGKTVAEARAAIQDHLKPFLDSPELSVDVVAYNSKVYYIITQGAGLGDNVRRLPVTGNETVLDAISQINGLSQVSNSKNIWIVRPSAADPAKGTILRVDWDAISRRGATATNYQILPRDRVYIGEDPQLTGTNLIAKKTAPVERAMGIISLTTSTVQGLSDTPGGAPAVKELVRKGVFDDDPELKQSVQEMIRLCEEESRKAAAKPAAEHKPAQ